MMRYILFFLVTLSLVSSLEATITLKELTSKPPSRAKNFMIWQYLKQDITPSQADKAYAQVEGNSNKILYTYVKKTKNKKIKRKVTCMKRKDLMSIKDKKCLELAFTPYKALKLSKKQRKKLLKRMSSKAKKNISRIQNEPYSDKAYIKYDPKTILTLFTSSTTSHRRKNLNIHINQRLINKIASSWMISKFIRIVVNDDKLNRLQLSLLNLEGEKLNSMNNFFLALNHLRHNNKKEAIKYFYLSQSKAKYQIHIDKNNFWLYQATDEDRYLQKLTQSKDINIYTLYANELKNKKVDNFFSAVETDGNKANILQNPFEWSKIRSEIKETPQEELYTLSRKYMQDDMVAVQSLIIEKAYRYKMHGYLMPYDIYLTDISLDEKALVYAIMRQESRLIPASLSRSYALGLMQIMPFVTDMITKTIDKPIKNYDEMFIPQNNINYALAHLKWMKKSLYHPLFMAYAYNGGMGFFKRHLLTGKFNSGKYEPFISLELMSNTESREYGKKVLANYVMYKKIMGESVSIVKLFNNLTSPKMTDKFRKTL